MYEDYEVLEAGTAAELNAKVAEAITAGKQPIGSVSVNGIHNGSVFVRFHYAQAVGTPEAP